MRVVEVTQLTFELGFFIRVSELIIDKQKAALHASVFDDLPYLGIALPMLRHVRFKAGGSRTKARFGPLCPKQMDLLHF